MLRNICLSIIFTFAVVGFAALSVLSGLASFSRFGQAVGGSWLEVSEWSGITDPAWGGFDAITTTPNVGAIGVMTEPEAYLRPDLLPHWLESGAHDPHIRQYVWRGGSAGVDYPVYFVGGVPVQRIRLVNGGPAVLAERPTPAWLELGILSGILVVDEQSGDVMTRPPSSMR